MSGSYRDLHAWQKAIDLVVDLHDCTRSFPKDEQYDLAAQLRRAAQQSLAALQKKNDVVPTTNSFISSIWHMGRGSKSRPSLQWQVA